LICEYSQRMTEAEKSRASRWRLKDLIAYECALARDNEEEWEVLRERDGRLAPEEPERRHQSRRGILLSWVKKRLELDGALRSTADNLDQSLSLAGQLLGLIGFLFGIAAATAALAYTGEAPINVSTFFGVFVLLQVLLATVLVLAFLLPRGPRERLAFGPLFRLTRRVFAWILDRVHTFSARFLSAQSRQNIPEWAGAARRALSLHGEVSKWVAFEKIQAATLFFNLGAMCALLFAVFFSDRAFGWQTTLQVPAESVQRLVEWVALPWSWAYGEGRGYPDLTAIEGSRIVLKEGTQALQNEDLASWWRFLAMGILFYGILPRLCFYFLGKWQVASALGRLDFRTAASERLMSRLVPPPSLFVSGKVPKESPSQETVEEVAGTSPGVMPAEILCLCAAELAKSFNPDVLRSALARHWGLDETWIKLEPYEAGKLDGVGEASRNTGQIALLFESWMPPIKEQERFLKDLREKSGSRVLIKLVPLGIPEVGELPVSFKPDKRYLEPWTTFVRRMGDPYLMLEGGRP
jgi:hypothetical protein